MGSPNRSPETTGDDSRSSSFNESFNKQFNNKYWHLPPDRRLKDVYFRNLNNIGNDVTQGFISELIVEAKYSKMRNPNGIKVSTYNFEKNFTENDVKSFNFKNLYFPNLNDIGEYLGPETSELTIGIKYAKERNPKGIKVRTYDFKKSEERFFRRDEKSVLGLQMEYLPNLNIGHYLHQYSPIYVSKINTGAMYENDPNPEGITVLTSFYENIIGRTDYIFHKLRDFVWIVALLSMFISAIYLFPVKTVTKEKEEKDCPSMLDYHDLYPMRYHYFWRQIQGGIDNVLDGIPPEPAVFFLVYSDEYTMKRTLNQITDIVKLCLDSRGGVLDMPLSELQSRKVVENYGLLIEKYRPILDKKRVMVVNDVQHVPAPVAPVFHTFCDTSAPVVKKAAILFTMQMDEDEIPSDLNDLIVKVEKDLQALWKDGVDVDKIMPLITRMTTNVLPVQPK